MSTLARTLRGLAAVWLLAWGAWAVAGAALAEWRDIAVRPSAARARGLAGTDAERVTAALARSRAALREVVAARYAADPALLQADVASGAFERDEALLAAWPELHRHLAATLPPNAQLFLRGPQGEVLWATYLQLEGLLYPRRLTHVAILPQPAALYLELERPVFVLDLAPDRPYPFDEVAAPRGGVGPFALWRLHPERTAARPEAPEDGAGEGAGE